MTPEILTFLGILVANIAGIVTILLRNERNSKANGEAISKTGALVDTSRDTIVTLITQLNAKHERAMKEKQSELEAAILRYLQCEERERATP